MTRFTLSYYQPEEKITISGPRFGDKLEMSENEFVMLWDEYRNKKKESQPLPIQQIMYSKEILVILKEIKEMLIKNNVS